MKYDTTHWENHRWERNDGRYYGAVIEQDLLGEWVLRRFWGGIGKPAGQMMVTPCENLEKAKVLLQAVTNRRSERNYIKH